MVAGIGGVSYVQGEQEWAGFFRTTVILQLEETPSKTPHTHWPRLQSVNSSVKSSSLLFSP